MLGDGPKTSEPSSSRAVCPPSYVRRFRATVLGGASRSLPPADWNWDSGESPEKEFWIGLVFTGGRPFVSRRPPEWDGEQYARGGTQSEPNIGTANVDKTSRAWFSEGTGSVLGPALFVGGVYTLRSRD